LYILGQVTFGFEPRAFQQAGPHVASIDRLGKHGFSVFAEHVIVDEDVLVSRADVDLEAAEAVAVGFGQDDLVD
jgi:hypothetical protein